MDYRLRDPELWVAKPCFYSFLPFQLNFEKCKHILRFSDRCCVHWWLPCRYGLDIRAMYIGIEYIDFLPLTNVLFRLVFSYRGKINLEII